MKIKYIFFFTIILFFDYTILFSQIDKEDLASKFKLNFTVPDFPAFKILGIEKSNLLKPSTTDIISFIASQVENPGLLSLPSAYSAEIAPILLLNSSNITLNNFKQNYIAYTFRISIGTTKDDSNSTNQLGIGFRITPIYDGDLRKDPAYQKKISENLIDRLKFERTLEMEYLAMDTNATIDSPETQEYVEEKSKEFNEMNDEIIENYKKEYEEKYWNRNKLDIALAWLGNTPDSLNNVKAQKYAGWITYAKQLSTWGQLMFGSNYEFSVKDKIHNVFLNARLYAGINKAKGFLETQFNYKDRKPKNKLLINLGSELSLFTGFWITYYAGLELGFEKPTTTKKFDSHFDFRFALP